MKQSLQRYGHIMNADDRYTRWQEVSQWLAYNFDWFRPTLPPTILDFETLQASTVFLMCMCHFLIVNFSMLED
jgi:hypothetical protein